MSADEFSALFAGVAVVISLIAIGISVKANSLSRQANDIASQAGHEEEQRFLKEGFFTLFQNFSTLPEINPTSLVGPDITKVATALEFIATAWNNNIVSKKILHENTWEVFKKDYELFDKTETIIPGFESNQKTVKSLLTDNIRNAYKDMYNQKF